jgi:hypothetical protein
MGVLPAQRREAGELQEEVVHREALAVLQEAGFKPMVGGAYALCAHTGIWRDTKDLDLFLRKDQIAEALALLQRAGYETAFTDPLWIAKAARGPFFIDLVFSSGNGICAVDERWRERAVTMPVLDRPSLVVPVEEMIWSKSFIQERERFDGADIHHLIRCAGTTMDWRHLLSRFGDRHWEVLFVHLVTFRYSFPREKEQVPEWVMREMLQRLHEREAEPVSLERICRGTLLSRQQYLHETNELGYRDARELESPFWSGDQAFPVIYPSEEEDDADRSSR